MEFDLEDPLACSISELFAAESDHMPSPNCLVSTHFQASFRCRAVSLILQVQFSCNLDPCVAYLAINYFHRFMSRREIPQEKRWLLELVVISCLSLASKMKNMSSLSDMQKEGCIFDAQSVWKMEFLILGALEWRMRSITPFPFLHFFISSAELKDRSTKQSLKERATKIIFNAHNDIKLLEYKPSTIAASALIISASHELSVQQCTMLRASITACSYLDEDTLTKCSDLMQEMARMDANESIIDTSLLSTETPVSVLERSIKRRTI